MKPFTWRTAVAVSSAAAIGLGGLFAQPGAAQPPAAALAATPVQLVVDASSNALVALMAAAGDRTSGTSVRSPSARPKHFWVDGFDRTTDTVSWPVVSPATAAFHARLLVDGTAGRQFELASATGRVVFTAARAGWDVVDVSGLPVPAGSSRLTLRPLSDGPAASIKSVELFPDQHWATLQSRVAQFKAAAAPTRDRFAGTGWGLMFQYGPWSYPRTGANPAMENHVNGFNVRAFADLVQGTGAGYVIWSISWWTYQLAAPSASVDAIVGNSNRTAQRDLIGELAREFKSRGLMFFLYYHVGQDEHLGYNSTDFWRAQQWPDSFTPTATGDRTVFFRNWPRIIGELGERYGRDLDGWFFDDGLVYYPANFEQLGQATRAGNPARLVSYNPWVAPRYTDFQDVSFGEECRTGAPAGGNGVIAAGPQRGLLEHCMSRMEQDWGVHAANTQIVTQRSAQALASDIRAAKTRRAPRSLNLMMWYPGVPSDTSLQVIRDMRNLLGQPGGLINDDQPPMVYTGAWQEANNRTGAGDFSEDVTYTSTNGDSVRIPFTGTGLKVLAPDSGPLTADVYLDGTLATTVNWNSATYVPHRTLYQVTGLAAGSHEVRIVKRAGSYLQIDAIAITS